MRRLSLIAVSSTLLLGACTEAVREAAPSASAVPLVDRGREPYAAVAERVLPSVVNVTTNVYRASPTGQPEQGRGVGTGFVVRPDGVIVTNCHVVQGASRITVSTSEQEPSRYAARVIGGDCEHDLAVLKVDAEGLPTVPLGSSADLRLGQQVVAIGYALALEGGPSVTSGIVSSLDRTIEVPDPECSVCPEARSGIPVRTYADVVQTDAAINHGNSGGPLVDMGGRVVGINSAGSDNAENIGFAIAIDSAKPAIEQAIAHPLQATAYLGVTTRDVTSDLAFQLGLSADSGAYVLATLAGGPADAGIREGDVIVEVDGHAIEDAASLARVLDGLRPGDEVEVRVVGSDDADRSVTVRLGTRPLPTEFLEP